MAGSSGRASPAGVFGVPNRRSVHCCWRLRSRAAFGGPVADLEDAPWSARRRDEAGRRASADLRRTGIKLTLGDAEQDLVARAAQHTDLGVSRSDPLVVARPRGDPCSPAVRRDPGKDTCGREAGRLRDSSAAAGAGVADAPSPSARGADRGSDGRDRYRPGWGPRQGNASSKAVTPSIRLSFRSVPVRDSWLGPHAGAG